jgi:hypothetical protein
MNDKTTSGKVACHCVEPCLICDCKLITNPPKKQIPKLGSAARAYLKRYAADLIDYADDGDRITSSLIDCCNHLLIEAERLERGTT